MTSYKIVQKNNPNLVHSVGYHGEEGKQKAQNRIDTGEAIKYYTDKTIKFIVARQPLNTINNI